MSEKTCPKTMVRCTSTVCAEYNCRLESTEEKDWKELFDYAIKLREENTELRQALKFALDNINESEGSPIFSIILDKARKIIGE